ncbi:hypothetical protein GGS21DRAFT_189307 [Xylaria nigripes]|nr:hypothetical protein GGS21DRAFT_189307 [Xylaria nigripes]
MPSQDIRSFLPPTHRADSDTESPKSSKSSCNTNNQHRITKRSPAKPKPEPKSTNPDSQPVQTDVLISIHSVHLANIVSRQKNHEYRKYRLRDGVERLWLYETAKNGGKKSITHIAVIPDSVRHTPGSVPTEPFGIGNEDFNAGLKQSKFGYPILELYELVNPVTLTEMKTKWGFGAAPMRWRYVGPDLCKDRWGDSINRDQKVKKIF